MKYGEAVQRDLVVVAADGYEFAASVYEVPGADTAVLVNSATAVPRRFYQRFAQFLQRYGWQVLTYDYRGIGGSKPPSLRGFDATMRDWTFLDMTAAVDWIARGEDLPKGVALEWARWCRHRNYLLDDRTLPLERYRAFAAPVLAYSIDDDDWGTRRAVDEMMRAYGNVTRRHIAPGDYGLERLGHTGFFREGAEPLWREMVEWLEGL